MKVSLITTVYNEEENIVDFIEDIFNMSRLPDEFIIVDAGSKDNTVNIINNYKRKYPQIKLIVKNKCNIAEGRNIAIRSSNFEIIAVTDAGCKIDKEWLKEIITPFGDENIDVVSGWYEPLVKNRFEKYSVPLLFPKLSEVNGDDFLPSSRSVAFKKETWFTSGGYPEFLTFAGEDTLFDLKLKKKGKFYFSSKAIVYWEPRKDIKSFIKQIYLYSLGDGEANIFKGMYTKKLAENITLIILMLSGAFTLNEYIATIFIIAFLYKYKRILVRNFKICIFSIPLFFIMELCQCIGFFQGNKRVKIVRKSINYLDE